MILKAMRIENFRQFKGHQEIMFAGGSSRNRSRCITVLYGENGRGKTGIFRALMFALYGDSRLSQDEHGKAGEISLVNRHELEGHPGQPVKALVELEFSHNGSEYRVHRELHAVKKKNGEIAEQPGEALLQVQGPDGNTQTWDEPEGIRRQINDVLDYRVREYFLFDGEKIERLTRANIEQRREVAAGIRNLLNIDDLQKAISAAEKLCRELDDEVKSKSTGELQQVIQDINQKEDACHLIEDSVSTAEEELKHVQREKRDTDEKLAQYMEIRGLVEERKRVESDKADLGDRLHSCEVDCRRHVAEVAFSLVTDTLQGVYENIDARRQKGDIPPLLRSDLIRHLMETRTCICGRELTEGSAAFAKIVEWMAKTPRSEETDAALQIWKQLGAILSDKSRRHGEAKTCLVQYADTKDAIVAADRRLEEIAKEIGSDERRDAAELQGVRDRLEKKEIELAAQMAKCQDQLRDLRLALEELGRRRQALENDASVRDTLIKRSQLARQTRDAMREVYQSFTADAAQVIGGSATDIMHRILDEEGRRNLKAVVVEDNYSLQMIDQWDGQFLANISAGQRQIMSIAFIAALAKAASPEQRLEMPLFMDTPFGRLSQVHRNNLIKEIPDLASQWVLLATDTELRREEGEALLGEGRLGRFYRLEAQDDGTTEIREQRMEDVPVILKASVEGMQ